MREKSSQRTATDPKTPANPATPLGLIQQERDGADRIGTALKVAGALALGLGLIVAFLGIVAANPAPVAIGFSSAISGLLLLAASSGLRLLVGISWLIENPKVQAPEVAPSVAV